MFTNILTVLIVAVCLLLFIGYFYIALWLIPKQEERRQILSWLAFLFPALSVLFLSFVWRMHEPLAKDFLPAFLVISVVIGLLFRELAISPYRLAKFWKKNPRKE